MGKARTPSKRPPSYRKTTVQKDGDTSVLNTSKFFADEGLGDLETATVLLKNDDLTIKNDITDNKLLCMIPYVNLSVVKSFDIVQKVDNPVPQSRSTRNKKIVRPRTINTGVTVVVNSSDNEADSNASLVNEKSTPVRSSRGRNVGKRRNTVASDEENASPARSAKGKKVNKRRTTNASESSDEENLSGRKKLPRGVNTIETVSISSSDEEQNEEAETDVNKFLGSMNLQPKDTPKKPVPPKTKRLRNRKVDLQNSSKLATSSNSGSDTEVSEDDNNAESEPVNMSQILDDDFTSLITSTSSPAVRTKAAVKEIADTESSVIELDSDTSEQRKAPKTKRRKRKSVLMKKPEPKKVKPKMPFKLRFGRTLKVSFTCDICELAFIRNVDLQSHTMHQHFSKLLLRVDLYRYNLPETFIICNDEDRYLKPNSESRQEKNIEDLVAKYAGEEVADKYTASIREEESVANTTALDSDDDAEDKEDGDTKNNEDDTAEDNDKIVENNEDTEDTNATNSDDADNSNSESNLKDNSIETNKSPKKSKEVVKTKNSSRVPNSGIAIDDLDLAFDASDDDCEPAENENHLESASSGENQQPDSTDDDKVESESTDDKLQSEGTDDDKVQSDGTDDDAVEPENTEDDKDGSDDDKVESESTDDNNGQSQVVDDIIGQLDDDNEESEDVQLGSSEEMDTLNGEETNGFCSSEKPSSPLVRKPVRRKTICSDRSVSNDSSVNDNYMTDVLEKLNTELDNDLINMKVLRKTEHSSSVMSEQDLLSVLDDDEEEEEGSNKSRKRKISEGENESSSKRVRFAAETSVLTDDNSICSEAVRWEAKSPEGSELFHDAEDSPESTNDDDSPDSVEIPPTAIPDVGNDFFENAIEN